MKARKKKATRTPGDGDIFGGPYSAPMWKEINEAKTVEDLQSALYFVCCRLQELEHRLKQHGIPKK